MKKDLKDLKIEMLEQQLVKQKLRDLARDSIGEFKPNKDGISKLTEQMTGFNFGIRCIDDNMKQASEWFEKLPDRHKDALTYLVLNHVVEVEVTPDKIQLWLDMKDVFAERDVQDIELVECERIVHLHSKFGASGTVAYVSHVRGTRPRPVSDGGGDWSMLDEAIAWIGKHG